MKKSLTIILTCLAIVATSFGTYFAIAYFQPIDNLSIDADAVEIKCMHRSANGACTEENHLIIEDSAEINKLYSILKSKYVDNHACWYDWEIVFVKNGEEVSKFAINEECTDYHPKLKPYLKEATSSR
jgi:hypothetical protein